MTAPQVAGTTETVAQEDEAERKRRRAILLRGAISGLAVLGIGAAITTAAWTDQAFFSAPATAATFNLQASSSATGPWTENDTAAGALVIPVGASQFGDLVPGSTARTVEVYVKNDSTVEANLSIATATSGTLFTTTGSTVSADATASSTTVAPGAVEPVTVSLTPGAMPDTLQGTTGTVLVTVTATTK